MPSFLFVTHPKQTAYLNLYNNSFTGKIPSGWNLRNLFYLDLGFNKLTGKVPTDWVTQMFALRVLYLSNNTLTGPLPTNFAQIGNNRLWLLSLNDNRLTGTMPGAYALRSLDLLEVQHNDFSAMDISLCRNIVFQFGEMASMRSDCQACPCDFFCGPGQCY